MTLLLALILAGPAGAASAPGSDEVLSDQDASPPGVIFLLDRSTAMNQDCGLSGSPSGRTCLEEVRDAIVQIAEHYTWAEFGVIGTYDSGVTGFIEIAPLGTSASDLDTALASVSATGNERNLAEAISVMADDYLTNTTTGNSDPWDDAPIEARCKEIHVITLTVGQPEGDSYPTHNSGAGLAVDVTCADPDYGDRDQCGYDNVAYNLLYNFDARADLTDTQAVVTHTVGIKIDALSIADSLYENVADELDGEAIYTVADEGDEILSRLAYVMGHIRQGTYSRSAPVLTASGDRLVRTWYEVTGDASDSEDAGSPLPRGHVRAYAVDDDPTSVTYGQVLYSGDSGIGGALWDAGELLVNRPAISGELNPMDQDGFGQRDIFTYEPFLAQYLSSTHSVWAEDSGGDQSTTRMNFDASFVDAVSDTNKLWLFLNYLFTPVGDHDFDGDSDVDTDDLQYLVDFVRGVPEAQFRYLDLARGDWKLGDSPGAAPAIVTARNNNFSNDPTYRRYLKALEQAQSSDPSLYPDLVLVPANDGMLHAFALEDKLDAPSGSLSSAEDDDQAGEELWAWVPSYVLYERESYMGPSGYLEDWSGAITDLLLYGDASIFNGHVVVEDVWIDEDNDGVKECAVSAFPADCEWHRVAVVHQGSGPSTLALDITIPAQPEFLWEHPTYYDAYYDDLDESALGMTTSRAVITNLYDREDSADRDRWVAIWGGGRAVPQQISSDAHASTEATLHFWHMSADQAGLYPDGVTFSLEGSNGHPQISDVSGLDSDGDGRYEYAYISGAITAIDYDSDGDADVLYFPLTATYEPADQGDPDGDGKSDLADVGDPGATWMFKAIIDPADLDEPIWCEFVDPIDFGSSDSDGNPARPEVFYAATAAWQTDGSLGIYWGSGSPYDQGGDDPGYLYAFVDPNPLSCGSTPQPLCDGTGMVSLGTGEGLTGEPIVYSGTVYFPTWQTGADACAEGTGRIWGLGYESCAAGIDADGDGTPESSSIEVEGFPSTLSVTDQGNLIWSGSDASDVADMLGPGDDPFRGVSTLMLKEIF
jgi:hypothetical protein